MILGGGQERDT